MSGDSPALREATIVKLAPVLGIQAAADLDTDNVLSNPRADINRILDQVPDSDVHRLLEELQERFPDRDEQS